MKLNLIISTLIINYAVSAISAQGASSIIGSGKNCTIINRKWNEALIHSSVVNINDSDDSDRRQIFTWIPGGCGDQCNWKIEKISTNSGLRYRLKPLKFDEYVYAASDILKRDDQRRNVFSRVPQNECNLWDIQALHDGHNNGYVTIKSTKYDEYLYAAQDFANYDENRRSVFTWKYTEKDVALPYDDACHWAIKCY